MLGSYAEGVVGAPLAGVTFCLHHTARHLFERPGGPRRGPARPQIRASLDQQDVDTIAARQGSIPAGRNLIIARRMAFVSSAAPELPPTAGDPGGGLAVTPLASLDDLYLSPLVGVRRIEPPRLAVEGDPQIAGVRRRARQVYRGNVSAQAGRDQRAAGTGLYERKRGAGTAAQGQRD